MRDTNKNNTKTHSTSNRIKNKTKFPWKFVAKLGIIGGGIYYVYNYHENVVHNLITNKWIS
jgi:hypothetical protein